MAKPWLGRVVWAIFPLQFVALDLWFRGPAAYARDVHVLLGGAQSVALWCLLATYRAHRAARVALAVTVGTVLTVQALFYRHYHVPIDLQVASTAVHAWADVRPVLAQMLPRTVATVALVAAFEYALLAIASTSSVPTPGERGPRRLPLVLALAAAALFAPPMRDSTPEIRLLPALALLFGPPRAAAAASVTVPPLPSIRDELPSVLLVLTESIRASDYCSAPEAECAVAPEVNRLLGGRVPLRQMRAVASYTAVSISAIVTGRTQEAPREEIARAPNVFELVKAVRARGVRPTVAYWSAHSESVFERKDVRSAVDSFTSLENLLGRNVDDDPLDNGFDRLLTARALRDIPHLQKPYFLVLHFAGTHAPYFMDEEDAPFQPWQHEITWTGLDRLRNAYKNSIHEQDKSIAACVRAFLASQGSSPYLIALTSDHGEAFGEHGAIHHGQNLFDEQIHVPAFVAASPGALTAHQESALRAHEHRFVTHLDLLPTLLDAYGALDGFAMAPYRAHLGGVSLLRPPAQSRPPLPITNCTGLFPCPLNTWGMLHEAHKLHAQSWDADWQCFDLGATETARSLTDPACLRLREASRAPFATLPNRQPNQ